MADEWVRVSVAGDQSASDTSHLPAELEMISIYAEVIGMSQRHVEHPHQQGNPEDGPCSLESYGGRGGIAGVGWRGLGMWPEFDLHRAQFFERMSPDGEA